MDKVDYKKEFKDLYLPKDRPVILDIPEMRFAALDGQGDPNGNGFALATAALYGFSYTVKMSYKSREIPEHYYDYTVFPLEGVWDLVDKTKGIEDKNNYAYTIMIRQPDFLTDELFGRFLEETKRKKSIDDLDRIRYETATEGLCCQMLHIGGYDDEPASFERMEQFCIEHGYARSSRKHREIYLSDPRKSETSKLRTVLRFQVCRK